MPPMRLRLGPATLGAGAGAGAVKMGVAMGARLGGLSKSSDEGILSYWGLRAYSCRLEGVMEPSEERWLPTLVKLRAVDTRLLGGGTSSLGWWWWVGAGGDDSVFSGDDNTALSIKL